MAVQNPNNSDNFLLITGPNDDNVATIQVFNENKGERSEVDGDGNKIDMTRGGQINDSVKGSLGSVECLAILPVSTLISFLTCLVDSI